jgi:hypothetical protein
VNDGTADSIWQRAKGLRGEIFYTSTNLPFTFDIEDNARIWFYRDGRRINRPSSRNQFNLAVERCPLRVTTGLSDLLCYAYLFGMLTDRRIRRTDW